MVGRIAVVLSLCVIALTSCTHPNRISDRALQRVARNGEPFVMVFGSLSTPTGTLSRPTIRFLHQADPSAPEILLWSLVISSGDRFYAVLHTPPPMPYLDTFYVEVGSSDNVFDRINFVRLREGDAPLAMYFGEIQMSPAQNRAAQGQMVLVSVRDDFRNAEQELRRLYPRFSGRISNAEFVRNAGPTLPPPERAR